MSMSTRIEDFDIKIRQNSLEMLVEKLEKLESLIASYKTKKDITQNIFLKDYYTFIINGLEFQLASGSHTQIIYHNLKLMLDVTEDKNQISVIKANLNNIDSFEQYRESQRGRKDKGDKKDN